MITSATPSVKLTDVTVKLPLWGTEVTVPNWPSCGLDPMATAHLMLQVIRNDHPRNRDERLEQAHHLEVALAGNSVIHSTRRQTKAFVTLINLTVLDSWGKSRTRDQTATYIRKQAHRFSVPIGPMQFA